MNYNPQIYPPPIWKKQEFLTKFKKIGGTKKAGTTSLLTSFLPVCRGVEADRQETITTRLLLPDTPSDVSIMRTDFHSLAIDHTCVSLDLDFSCSFSRQPSISTAQARI